MKAGDWIVCRNGCDDCCRRPFAITLEDANRLLAGLQLLPSTVAGAIRARADAAWEAMRGDFPGDAESGALTDSAEWRSWFFGRHSGLPCPVLDPAKGTCLLYSARPVCCRIYGPLIQIGSETNDTSDPCPLCYSGATPEQVEASRVRVDFPEDPRGSETTIAYALSLSAKLSQRSGPPYPQSS